jgi:hypothetical protein
MTADTNLDSVIGVLEKSGSSDKYYDRDTSAVIANDPGTKESGGVNILWAVATCWCPISTRQYQNLGK